MRIVISGSSGLIGQALTTDLQSQGHQVVRLVRSPTSDSAGAAATWDPANGTLDPAVLEGAGAVINLNGRSIADGRWTSDVKAQLRASRLASTTTLAKAISTAAGPPPLLINASAVGYYGDRGEEVLDENSAPGDGFLADLARDWENAALAAASDATRVVLLRLAMVIGHGGALERMLLPFKLGAGGPMGSGRQWWPWVAIDDITGVVRFVLDRQSVEGPLNLASPQEVRCAEFAKILGGVLNRPAFMPLPAFAARLAMGEMADALLLASIRARPKALQDLGYEFQTPDLATAIRHAID